MSDPRWFSLKQLLLAHAHLNDNCRREVMQLEELEIDYEAIASLLPGALSLIHDEWDATHEDSPGNEWIAKTEALLARLESSHV